MSSSLEGNDISIRFEKKIVQVIHSMMNDFICVKIGETVKKIKKVRTHAFNEKRLRFTCFNSSRLMIRFFPSKLSTSFEVISEFGSVAFPQCTF